MSSVKYGVADLQKNCSSGKRLKNILHLASGGITQSPMDLFMFQRFYSITKQIGSQSSATYCYLTVRTRMWQWNLTHNHNSFDAQEPENHKGTKQKVDTLQKISPLVCCMRSQPAKAKCGVTKSWGKTLCIYLDNLAGIQQCIHTFKF